ncbi:TPA: multidrug effflux MFS transporter [Legionella anisa]|uniref:Bcr/CflA family efflux transporter n=4 Tax=Legionella anisa TaxID=28082 RepID=A0AAX0WPQ7_9GAMM|nr:multidrug effflux MFS transporter [Legionella anisa]AWN73166.1 MFS transporter [Legionella anisa]PNL60284.1 Bcr/CflA family drug resistance efflux transporter [Legionella anisa]
MNLTNQHSLQLAIVIISCALVSIGQLASVIYLPSLPEITHALHTNSALVGSTLTMYMFFFGISQLIGGALSDIFGRKPVILFGMTIYIVAAVSCATAETITVLLLGRAVEGLGAGCITSVARATLNDSHSGTSLTKAIGYSSIIASLTSMFSPTLGGLIQLISNWRFIFWCLAGYCLIIMVITIYLFEETSPWETRQKARLKDSLFHLYALNSNRQFIKYTLTATLSFAAMSSYYVASPFMLQQGLHLSPVMYSLTFILTSAGFITGSLINQTTILPADRLLSIANMIMTGSLIILTLVAGIGLFNIYTVLVPIVFMTGCIGILYPRGMSAAVAPFKHMAGSAAAVVGCAQMTFSAIGVLIMSHLPKTYPLPMALTLTAISLMVTLIYHCMDKR